MQIGVQRGTVRLRIAGPGSLDYLEREYNTVENDNYATLAVAAEATADKKAKQAARKRLKEQYGNRPPSQLRPSLSLYQGYARPAEFVDHAVARGTIFSPHFISLQLEREQGPCRELDPAGTLTMVTGWREAILSYCDGEPDAVRSLLSGHDLTGAPLKAPHLAFLPLPFVGHEHADGHLIGMGLVLPAALGREERRAALRVIGQVRRLKLGRLGTWKLLAVTESRPSWDLRPETWTAHPEGATQWSTITPVAFDRHSKARNKAAYQCALAGMIAEGCERIGLPAPRDVIITPVSAHLGASPAHAFPRLQRKDGSERRHSHTILVFDEPLRGPILIGAGRFRGYGVCRPLEVL